MAWSELSSDRNSERIPLFDDPVFVQSALDRLAHNAYQLAIEGGELPQTAATGGAAAACLFLHQRAPLSFEPSSWADGLTLM